MNLQQFHDFRINYIEDPKGSLEFFQRTVFQVRTYSSVYFVMLHR
jgi:hypothetical protein